MRGEMATDPPHITSQGRHTPGATTPLHNSVTEAPHRQWGICRHEDPPADLLPPTTENIPRHPGGDLPVGAHHPGITHLNQEVGHPQGKIKFISGM